MNILLALTIAMKEIGLRYTLASSTTEYIVVKCILEYVKDYRKKGALILLPGKFDKLFLLNVKF